MMVVRPVTEADNDALCRMELLAPQGTTIRLTERRFEFAARSRQFPGAVLYVAADDTSGDLAAVLGGAPVAMRLGGKERMAGVLFDLRANPAKERGLSRILLLLWQAVEKQLIAGGAEFMIGMVKADNPALSIYYRLGAVKKGTRRFWSFPVYKRRPVPAGLVIGAKLDARDDYQAAGEWYKDYDLWPLNPDWGHMQSLQDRYTHAEINYAGASLKIWDTTVDNERVVTAMPRIFHWARPLAQAAGAVIPLPRIPRVGQPLRTWFLYDLRVPAGSRALKTLIAAANNLALAEKVDFLIFSSSPGEIELAGLNKGTLYGLDYHFLVRENPGCEPVPDLLPRTYFDIRMT